MTADHCLMLADGLHAPAHARAWVGERTVDLPREVCDDALLMVSELVTNAVRHGDPDIVLSLFRRADRLRIEVYDSGTRLPVLPHHQPSADRPTGRGLLIVAATAADWGVSRPPDRPGKTVWAELHTCAAAPASR